MTFEQFNASIRVMEVIAKLKDSSLNSLQNEKFDKYSEKILDEIVMEDIAS